MKNKKSVNFSKKGDVQKYVNFINDNDLCNKLDNFETGFINGDFFIELQGDEDIIDHISRLSMKSVRGKYERTSEHKVKQSKIQMKKK